MILGIQKPRKWVNHYLALLVKFEEEDWGTPPNMIVLRTGAPCANHQRGTIITAGTWSGLRVNLSTIKIGRFIKSLTANKDILRGQVVGGRIKSVERIKQW